jgi:hypothetical protein
LVLYFIFYVDKIRVVPVGIRSAVGTGRENLSGDKGITGGLKGIEVGNELISREDPRLIW